MRDAKRALRDRVLAARDRLPADAHRASSRAIAATLAARDDFRAARTVLLTLPFRGEWDTSALIAAALDAGKVLVLPRVNQASRMLELCAVVDLDRETVGGFHGIREPDTRCAPVAPDAVDWVLVPGVAFDRECRRLGYGGGYYDRLLPSIAASAPRIAGAFELQVVDRVPATQHDLGVDAVVTEERTLAPSR
jgi:5-formyltetrahydrofolate cyclo-ligase